MSLCKLNEIKFRKHVTVFYFYLQSLVCCVPEACKTIAVKNLLINLQECRLARNILLSRPQIRDTAEKIEHSWQLPSRSFLRDMSLFKVEGQGIYIFKSPSQDCVPESNTSVIFLQTPLLGGSPAIPLVRAD